MKPAAVRAVAAAQAAALSAADRKLADGVVAGDRRALAKAITLVESARADHQARAQQLLEALLPHTGKTIRVGVSGAPGVGKSTFVESLGLHLLGRGHRLAVLAVDPSSTISGGSILGDKTRMEQLSQRLEAFIRPSPSGGSLGGVAQQTREALLVCEAAGFDVIVVETVGVGQSEVAVAGMTDVFVLLQLPNAGDELQAMKKGIVEIADLVVLNKADIDRDATELARRQIESALHLLQAGGSGWRTPVLKVSARAGQGIAEFWGEIERFRSLKTESGEFAERRRRQALAWMWEMIDQRLRAQFRAHHGVKTALPRLSNAVAQGSITPSAAAGHLLDLLRSGD